MKHLTLIVTLALIAVIGYAFFTALDVFAAGSRVMDTRQARCVSALNIAASTHAPKGANPHPMCVPSGKGESKEQDKSKDNTPATVSTPAPIVTTAPNTPVVTPTPVVHDTPAPAVSDKGNPGNVKGVGNAGENPNGRDTMPLDNAGGNGNGEHGNQGVNH